MEPDCHALALRKAEIRSCDEGGRIRERKEPDVQLAAHQAISDAVMSARAISPIRTFWFIAERRIIA